MPRSTKNAKAVEIVDEKGVEVFPPCPRESGCTILAGKLAPGEGGMEDGNDAHEIIDLS